MCLYCMLNKCIMYNGIHFNNYSTTIHYFLASVVMTPFYLPDDEASARSALQYLGRDIDINSELKTMIEKFREEQQQKQIWRELFTVKSNKISLFITVGLAFFQQSSGIIAVILFATTIFKDAGSSVRPDIATIIVGATFALGACISPIFIEKYGRRILLMISTAGCCVSMVRIHDPKTDRLTSLVSEASCFTTSC